MLVIKLKLHLWQGLRKVDIDTKSQFLAFLDSHSQLKKLIHMPARNYMELDYGSHLDDGPLSRGRYDISYCLKGEKLRKTQILILLPLLH